MLPEKLKFVKLLELKALNIRKFSSILGAVATSKRLAHTVLGGIGDKQTDLIFQMKKKC